MFKGGLKPPFFNLFYMLEFRSYFVGSKMRVQWRMPIGYNMGHLHLKD
jgi:hypothetical protein